jgi:nitrogen PTS system EIIA component
MTNAAGSPDGPSEREGVVEPRRIYLRLSGTTREQVLEELATRLAADGAVPDAIDLVARLIDRERLGCTGLGGGVAIPHCKLRNLRDVVVALGTTAVPIEFGAADGVPISVVFLVASPADAPAEHLQTLARISRLLRTPGVVDGLKAAKTPDEADSVLRSARTGQAVAS